METSLIVPAYNEKHRIHETLTAYGDAMSQRFGDDFEIIVVANGSTDGTAEVALRDREDRPQIRVVDIVEKVGKGGAVLQGFRRARGRKVAFADADGATNPRSLLELFDGLEESDVVIGSRRLPESVIEKWQPALRRLLGTGFATGSHFLFGLPFRDTQCGAKAFRRGAAQSLARSVSETRWTFDLDLLLAARKLGLKIYEHPVVWADREGTSLRYGSTTFEVLRALWSMKARQKKPLAELPDQPILGEEYERAPRGVEEAA